MIVLYTTGCPKCNILKGKLNDKNVSYTINDNVDDMLELGIESVPVLGVKGELLNYTEALMWLSKQEEK